MSRANARHSQWAPDAAKEYYNELVSLPAPPETFVFREFPKPLRARIKRLRKVGHLEVVGTVERTTALGDLTKHQEYRVPEWLYQQFQERDASPILPCGHRGVLNVRDRGFMCKAKWCGEEFDREQIAAVIGE